MYGSVLQPVPVVIVGSHHDEIPPGKEIEVVANAQRLVDEMREVFEEHLDVSPRLYPLNCLKAVSVEMKVLKEQLCVVRSKLLEVSCLHCDDLKWSIVTSQVQGKKQRMNILLYKHFRHTSGGKH